MEGVWLELYEVALPIGHDPKALEGEVRRRLGLSPSVPIEWKIWQRAVDARARHEIRFSYTVQVAVPQNFPWKDRLIFGAKCVELRDRTYREFENFTPSASQKGCSTGRPVVVGTGPAGMFCGLMLARHGMKPIMLERGKAVGPRARDVTGFWRGRSAFQPESNVQFGEGGAGTFSDGKLYTQIRDREHRIPWILREMVKFGAPEDILLKARPHVGTDRLAGVVRKIRQEIESLGGEYRFETRVVDVLVDQGNMKAVVLQDGSQLEGGPFIFAVGHSARDVFECLWKKGLAFEPKPFSVGVRIEHPQSLIDRAIHPRWAEFRDVLGSANYQFSAKVKQRTAYSFCMCPGGLVVAATSEFGGVVTNGMSSYARAESNANAGFMVEVSPEDCGAHEADPLAGIRFQRAMEQTAFEYGQTAGDYCAPAQKLGDFLKGKATTGPGSVLPSYLPGVRWGEVDACLPEWGASTLRSSVPEIAKKLRGFDHGDAILTGVETRSSAPARMLRDPSTYEGVGIRNFYPAGEGAGYAGGIISAAVDGLRIAESIVRQFA